MSKMPRALAGLAAVGVLAGGIAIAAPAQASTPSDARPVSESTEAQAEAQALRPGDLCWVAHDQAPVYHGPSLDSGIKEFLGRTHYVVIGQIPNLVEVLHSETLHRIGYMQQADLYRCVGRG